MKLEFLRGNLYSFIKKTRSGSNRLPPYLIFRSISLPHFSFSHFVLHFVFEPRTLFNCSIFNLRKFRLWHQAQKKCTNSESVPPSSLTRIAIESRGGEKENSERMRFYQTESFYFSVIRSRSIVVAWLISCK